MPLQATSGAASYDGFGGGVAAIPNYIEDVFSTYLYSGNDASQTVNNGIDLSTKGGLVWIKSRNLAGTGQFFQDTVRGANQFLDSTTTGANQNISAVNTTFTTTGFTQNNNYLSFNGSGYTYASWTFRKQPKFFDVVTYTGTGSATTIAHNLGSVPGCIIVKQTSASGNYWTVYHTSLGNTQRIFLNTTDPSETASSWNNTTPTSTVFSVGTSAAVNGSGSTYVAYLFAHNAGGFGLTGTDNVISCGSYTGNGSTVGPTVTLGYEPQWLLVKKTDNINGTEGWSIWDNVRNSGLWDDWFQANSSQAEQVNNANVAVQITSTGFYPNAANNTSNSYVNTSGATYIYIAIRRGPMKVPTVGTTVFSPQIYTGTNTTRTLTTAGFPIDLVITDPRSGAFGIGYFDRLRGATKYLNSAGTGAEGTGADSLTSFASMNGYTAEADNDTALINYTPNYVNWLFKRAPSFFDEVCYTGTGTSGQTIAHNLGVIPELAIFKARSTGSVNNWQVYYNFTGSTYSRVILNTTGAESVISYGTGTNWLSQPTSTTFTAWTSMPNENTITYVAYLFATCAGVSKVGSYTGNGTTQTIDCGFTGGARFVLVKRTDSTGNWGVLDTARGMVSGTDPYLNLNTTAAEVNANNVYTTTGGFQLVSSDANFNANGGSYIFLAVA